MITILPYIWISGLYRSNNLNRKQEGQVFMTYTKRCYPGYSLPNIEFLRAVWSYHMFELKITQFREQNPYRYFILRCLIIVIDMGILHTVQFWAWVPARNFWWRFGIPASNRLVKDYIYPRIFNCINSLTGTSLIQCSEKPSISRSIELISRVCWLASLITRTISIGKHGEYGKSG